MAFMAVFLSNKNWSLDYWNYINFAQEMKLLRKEQKDTIQKCHNFLEKITFLEMDRVYQTVGANWKRLAGDVAGEQDIELGKTMVFYHLDDPFVSKMLIDYFENKKSEPSSKALCQNSENTKKVKSADIFNTECTIHLLPNLKPQAQRCITIAFRTLNYAARHIPFSANKVRKPLVPVI
jgi:hypothetical protein